MSSNSQFRRVLAPYEHEYISFRKEILYDSRITGNALKLLLVMLDFGKRPGWQLWQNHLIGICGFGWTMYDNAIKSLITAGYVRRHRDKIGSAYHYEFSSFPLFLEESYEKEPHKEFEPVRVSQTDLPELGNPNLNLSYISNVLEETTNQEKENQNLVSSSFEKLKELEDVGNISESQKKTIYTKFPHEKILMALKAIDLSKAACPFALIYSALKKNYHPCHNKDFRNDDACKVFSQAEEFLSRHGSCPISLAIDEKNAYIYHGTATTKYPLNDSNFKDKFAQAINDFLVDKTQKNE